jgi:hypothetical protein
MTVSPDVLGDLVARVQRIEDLEEIRRLRARYFSALDDRDLDGIGAVFAADAEIGMGDWGVFPNTAAFLEKFAEESIASHLFDLHHGANHVVDITGPDTASGRWDAFYSEVNADGQSIYTEAYAYADIYEKRDGRWVITKTDIRSVVTVAMATRDDGAVVFEQLRPE